MAKVFILGMAGVILIGLFLLGGAAVRVVLSWFKR
jgi:hypothetical protein